MALGDPDGREGGDRRLRHVLLAPLGLVIGSVMLAIVWVFVVGGDLELVAGQGAWAAAVPVSWLVGILLAAAGGLGAVVVMARRLRCEVGEAAGVDALFADVAHAGADFIWQTDAAGRLRALSDGFARCSGRPGEEAIGRTWLTLPGIAVSDAMRRSLRLAMAAARAFRDVEISLPGVDGEPRHMRLIGRPFFGAEGRLAGYRGAGIDISDVVETRQRLAFVDHHDSLTGLLNRVGALRALAALLGRHRQTDQQPVILVVDIDRFRGINEAFGAAAGDRVIQQVAERIRVCARDGDVLGRLSAAEFMVLRPNLLPFDPLLELLGRLERTLDERFSVAGETLKVCCKIGVYEIAEADREPEICLRRAQLAVTQARRDGRATRLFMVGMDVEAETTRRLEEDLRHAVDHHRLTLSYQPQLDLRTGRYCGAEALMRWHHREHGFVSPARFIPLAERTGVVIELSRWALRQACLDSRQLGDLQLSVNLSPIDLAAADCVEQVIAVLEATGAAPGRLELEITEGVLIEDTDATLDVLLRLKRLGVKIALDDFGTGYAGLGYLQVFPFDKLKIDQSFIRRVTRSRHAASIVRSVVALAHELGLTVCAEGVETEDQLRLLRAEGCDLIQGFFAGQPMSASQLRQLVERQAVGPIGAAAGATGVASTKPAGQPTAAPPPAALEPPSARQDAFDAGGTGGDDRQLTGAAAAGTPWLTGRDPFSGQGAEACAVSSVR